jgi:hypothetical protein
MLIEQNEVKIKRIKEHFVNYEELINTLEDYNDLLINDLHGISLYNPNHYIHPSVKIYICNIIYKYINEFRNDEKIIDFFRYILSRYNCFSE